MSYKLVLHIPHASSLIPDSRGFLINDAKLNDEINLLTDWFTDELFESEMDICVKAGFSRVFCDVERFYDDKIEPMAKSGMGVIYTTCDDGSPLRTLTAEERGEILQQYYHPHHQNLFEVVERQLTQTNSVFILDCHSFSDTPFKRDTDQHPNRPDFCIGTDSFHTPKITIDIAAGFFEDAGFRVGIDWPYKGTMVPDQYYQKDIRVKSLMLEVNRKLYLGDGKPSKSEGFNTIRTLIQHFLDTIRELLPTV